MRLVPDPANGRRSGGHRSLRGFLTHPTALRHRTRSQPYRGRRTELLEREDHHAGRDHGDTGPLAQRGAFP